MKYIIYLCTLLVLKYMKRNIYKGDLLLESQKNIDDRRDMLIQDIFTKSVKIIKIIKIISYLWELWESCT